MTTDFKVPKYLVVLSSLGRIVVRTVSLVSLPAAVYFMLTEFNADHFQRGGAALIAVAIFMIAVTVGRLRRQIARVEAVRRHFLVLPTGGGQILSESNTLLNEFERDIAWFVRVVDQYLLVRSHHWGYADLFHGWYHG